MWPDVTTGHRVFASLQDFKRSDALVVKVLQTSKNLVQKTGNMAVMEKAGGRSLEGLSAILTSYANFGKSREALPVLGLD